MNIQATTSYRQNSQSFGQVIPKWRAYEQIQKTIFDIISTKPEDEQKAVGILKEISNFGEDLQIPLHAQRKRVKNMFQFSLSIPHTKPFEPIAYDKSNPLKFLETLKEQILNSDFAQKVRPELEKLRLRQLEEKSEKTMIEIFGKK